jgi:anti-sigma factor RsiW
MNDCANILPRISLYVDSEFTGTEVLEIEAHLTVCDECKRAYDSLRETVDAVRGASPLYEAPDHSYALIEENVRSWDARQRRQRWVSLSAAAAVFIALLSVAWWKAVPTGYESFAAQAHLDFARGAFPLDVNSNQPQTVSNWLEPRVPFHLTLPNYPEGGVKRYSMSGARLMQYRGENVAYLAYEMDHKPISLLIAASSRIAPSGGETYQASGLTFYFRSEKGLRIITWRDKGLTYAQVSDLNVNGAESCVICHGKDGERPKFEGLGRRM